jgi:molybdate transport system ATP-binding protein
MSLAARVSVRRDAFALDAAILLQAGETVALLGPNASGKTTFLHALAGLVPLDAGRITLDGLVLDDVAEGVAIPTEERPIGMVFQDGLLFPHLTVLENVAFGLRSRGRSRGDARRIAREWLDRMDLGDRAAARPTALSGGQVQRVALARALAVEPRLLLLDEPLAAVDVQARAALRRDLRTHLTAFGGIRLLVTHDPLEAFALADRVIVLEQGHIVQSGTVAAVTARPRSRWVADLAGLNLFRGRADGGRVSVEGGGQLVVAAARVGDVFAVVHPRAVTVLRTRPDGSPRNVWHGRIEEIDVEGTVARVRVATVPAIVAEVTMAAVGALSLAAGEDVWITVKATEIVLYPA